MSDIFISYGSEDRAIAQKLAATLADEGWTVFWDQTIPAGKTWRQVIDAALEEAHCVVVLWSRSSIASDWVHEEADEGRERNILIPVLIDDVRPPRGFRSMQAADLAGWDGSDTFPAYGRMITDIEGVLGPAPVNARKRDRRKAEEDVRKKADEEAARTKAEAAATKTTEEEQARQEGEMQAEQKAEKDMVDAKRRAEDEGIARKRSEAEKPVAETPYPQPRTKPTKALWIAGSAAVVVLGIGLAVYQPWRSPPPDAPRVEAKSPAAVPGTPTESMQTARPDMEIEALEPGEIFRDCDICPEMVVVPAGSFMMGSSKNDPDTAENEVPEHWVTIPQPFAVGLHEVTNAEFVAFLNAKGRRAPADEPWFKTKNEEASGRIISSGSERYEVEKGYEIDPVVNVSWYGARAYANWLKEKTGNNYRLLTESEWEYTARAGTTTRYWWGDEIGSNNANCGICGSRWDDNEPHTTRLFWFLI